MTNWRSKDVGKVGSDRPRPFLVTMTSDSIPQHDYWPCLLHPAIHWFPKWNLGPLVVFKGGLCKIWQTSILLLLVIFDSSLAKMSFYSAENRGAIKCFQYMCSFPYYSSETFNIYIKGFFVLGHIMSANVPKNILQRRFDYIGHDLKGAMHIQFMWLT